MEELSPERITAKTKALFRVLGVKVKKRLEKILSLWKKVVEKDVTIVYISHDLTTISYITNRLAIMYPGKILENGLTENVIINPLHPYTQALISAVPSSNPAEELKLANIKGTIPDPSDLPSGCRFRSRCK